MKAQSHSIPQRLQNIGNGAYYINFNVKQDWIDNMEGDPVSVYVYDCVRVDRLTRDNVISAIIRDHFSADNVEAITNNYLNGGNAIDFIKLQLYREYAKLIADDADQALIDEAKQRKVYEVKLPLEATLPGGDYSEMADRMLRLKVPFKADLQNNQATVYPGWIDDDDLAILDADPRVSINQIELFT